MESFSALLAKTASSYTRYKLRVSSVHHQSGAAPKHQAKEARNVLEAKSGWRHWKPEGSRSPKALGTGDVDGVQRGVMGEQIPPL